MGQSIVEQDGINTIMKAIAKYANHDASSERLMTRCIKTLDFIAMAHTDYAMIVNAHGGDGIITRIMDEYVTNADIQRAGKSALIFLREIDDDDDMLPPPPPPPPPAGGFGDEG